MFKETFASDKEVNAFFERFCDKTTGRMVDTFYLIKLIITFNVVEQRQEQHVVYSVDPRLRGKDHMQSNGSV